MEFELGSGLVNIDGADMASVVEGGKRIVFCLEDGHETGSVSRKIHGAKGLLIGIQGPKSITIQECQKVVENLSRNVKKSANIVWGASTGKKKLLVVAVW